MEIHIRQLAETLSARHQVTVGAVKFCNFLISRRLRVLEYSLLAAKRGDPRKDGFVQVCSLAPTPIGRLKMAPLLFRATPRLQRHYYHQINGLTRPFYLWATGGNMRDLIRDADIVHCRAFGDLGIAAERAARQAGIPFVCAPEAMGRWAR